MFRSCLLGELYENLSMETNKYLRGPRYSIQHNSNRSTLFLLVVWLKLRIKNMPYMIWVQVLAAVQLLPEEPKRDALSASIIA